MYASLHFFFREVVRTDTKADWPTFPLANISSGQQVPGAGSGLNLVRHTLLRPGGVRQQEWPTETS